MRARGRVALLSLFGLLRMVIYLLPERFLLPQPQFLPLFCPRPFMPRPHLLSWPVPPVSVMLFLLAPAAHCPASLPVFGPRPFGPVPFIPGMIHLLCVYLCGFAGTIVSGNGAAVCYVYVMLFLSSLSSATVKWRFAGFLVLLVN